MTVKVHKKEIMSHGREVARCTSLLLIARTLRFPPGGFPAFPRAELEAGDPCRRFSDYLGVVLKVCGRFLSDGRPRSYLAKSAYMHELLFPYIINLS